MGFLFARGLATTAAGAAAFGETAAGTVVAPTELEATAMTGIPAKPSVATTDTARVQAVDLVNSCAIEIRSPL